MESRNLFGFGGFLRRGFEGVGRIERFFDLRKGAELSALREHDIQYHRVAVTQHFDAHRLARRDHVQCLNELSEVTDRLARDANDLVADPRSRVAGGRGVRDVADHYRVTNPRIERQAQPTAMK